MSLTGLKKQLNKANQYLSETMGAAEPTKLDVEFHEMERKIDLTDELVDDLMAKTREYLQPNPATRAKMASVAALSKIRGGAKSTPYPQTEGVLGESMHKYGKALGDESCFGNALVDSGEAYKQMADIKYALEDAVKQNFLDPMTQLKEKDLRDVHHHRKKLHGRRLDYDCKKRKQTSNDEMGVAEEKLEESKKLAEEAMWNVLDNDVEQISQLCALIEAKLEFHRQTSQVLESLHERLKSRATEAAGRPRSEHTSKPVLLERSSSRSRSPVPPDSAQTGGHTPLTSNSHPAGAQDPWSARSAGPPPAAASAQDPWGPAANAANAAGRSPSCKALYDFDAENEGELAFREGQVITLVSQIDENWFEGSLPSGASGFFPISYVQVLVPLR